MNSVRLALTGGRTRREIAEGLGIGLSTLSRQLGQELLKRELLRRRTYPTREAATQDVFEYIEIFHNPKRKHTNNCMLSRVYLEARQQKLSEASVSETRGTSRQGLVKNR